MNDPEYTHDPLGLELLRQRVRHDPQKSPRARLQDTIHYWRKVVKDHYPEGAFAKTATGRGVRPDQVDETKYGHHTSAVFSKGVRTWVFTSQKQRDQFVNYYRAFGAAPCGNPYP